MILESKEEAIASKMKTSSPASVSLSRITCWASTTSNHPRGKMSPNENIFLSCQKYFFHCSRLRNSGRGQLEVSRRRPGHQRRLSPSPTAPPSQLPRTRSRQVSAALGSCPGAPSPPGHPQYSQTDLFRLHPGRGNNIHQFTKLVFKLILAAYLCVMQCNEGARAVFATDVIY